MTKMKTHQATAKRFRKTSTGKIQRRTAGQAHFNRRDSGKDGRQKRAIKSGHKAVERIIQINLPYQA
jgi:large subunit ribosomal protein L35